MKLPFLMFAAGFALYLTACFVFDSLPVLLGYVAGMCMSWGLSAQGGDK
jgi:hypothetical protein